MSLFGNLRFWLAGPATLVVAYVLMAAMPVWFPPGVASINHLAFPVVLFPAFWAVLFFYAVLAERLWRAAGVFAALALVNGGLVAWSIGGG